jgi:hypothetical protein
MMARLCTKGADDQSTKWRAGPLMVFTLIVSAVVRSRRGTGVAGPSGGTPSSRP